MSLITAEEARLLARDEGLQIQTHLANKIREQALHGVRRLVHVLDLHAWQTPKTNAALQEFLQQGKFSFRTQSVDQYEVLIIDW